MLIHRQVSTMRKFVKQNIKKTYENKNYVLLSAMLNMYGEKQYNNNKNEKKKKITQELKAKSSIQQFEWCCMLSVRRDICRNERQWAINQDRVTYSMVKGGTRTEMDPRDVYINIF